MTGKEEMTVRNKKSISLLSLIAAVFTVVTMAALPARAADSFFVYNNPQTGYSVYIDDDQDLLTDDEEQSLIEEMIPITEYGNVGFISCDNTSESTASYSARRYSSLFGSDSGAVLVIDMGQRMIYIKNNGAVSKIITNAYSNTITDNIAHALYQRCAAGSGHRVFDQLSLPAGCDQPQQGRSGRDHRRGQSGLHLKKS